ncbi:MAG: hypothetical protein ACOYBL_11175 [Lachnospiraceae bacterium]
MYYSRTIPFYTSCRYPQELERELALEEDMQKMKSYFPKTAARIQEKVETLCDRMEYDGSFLYDEYPDRFMMGRMCDYICKQMEEEQKEMQEQALHAQGLRELVEVLFFHEMHHRRCRRGRCRRFF